jgi:arginyl-tRNA synthetase
MKHYVKQLIDEVLGQYKASEAISDFPNYDIMIPKAEFGDLATNIAMILAKQLKQNPQTIATDIAEKLKKPINTVRTLIRRARLAVRSSI